MSAIVSDRPLAPGALDGPCDDTWFSAMYQSTFEGAFRYARMLTRDADLSADIVADVYLRAWLKRDSLKESPSLTAWILTVTRNRVNDEFRARRTTVDLDQIEELQDVASDGRHVELTETERAQLHQAIRRLPAEQQHVIFLRFFQHLSHEQVANELGRTANAVRVAQFRALARLRTMLEVPHAG